jgi:predicted NACHT family NTPase
VRELEDVTIIFLLKLILITEEEIRVLFLNLVLRLQLKLILIKFILITLTTNLYDILSILERISTGVPGLDSLIEGGIPKGSTIMVVGNSGSGKTILSSHFLYDGKQV